MQVFSFLILYSLCKEVKNVVYASYCQKNTFLFGAKKWSKLKLSKVSGVSLTTINKLINEKQKTVRFKTFFLIVKAFDIELSDFFATEEFDRLVKSKQIFAN